MRETVRKSVLAALEDLGDEWALGEVPAFEVEVPRSDAHGDMACNVAMQLARPLRQSPRKIAERITGLLGQSSDLYAAVEIAGPGFINFRFSSAFWYHSLGRILGEDPTFLRPQTGGGKRVQVEFVSANPTGPLHIGHGRGAALGLALSNLLEAAGYQVEREFYVNDAGRQVRLLGLSVFARYQELLGERVSMPEDGYHGEYVRDIAQRLLDEKGERYRGLESEECGQEVADWACGVMLDEIRKDLEAFGVRFDTWKSEKELYTNNAVQEALSNLRKSDRVYTHEAASWFRSSLFGDEKDRVVVKANGEFTYFASDIAYHKDKLDRGYDAIIDIWGADHHGYVPRVSAVLQAFGYDKSKFQVLLVQIVNLLRGGEPVKMSKRAGDFITLKEVVDEVGADTTKFIFLTRRSDSHLDFDIEVAREQSPENPVYYVQYAHARINSIFRQAPAKGFGKIEKESLRESNLTRLNEAEDIGMIRMLCRYPLVFEDAARTHEPHRITFYLQELASLFHTYYTKHRVLVEEDHELARARMALAWAVEVVLKDGLSILGVHAPEQM